MVDADHVTGRSVHTVFVLFYHQSHATPGDHGAMYTLSDFRPQSAQRRHIAISPLPSVRACPTKICGVPKRSVVMSSYVKAGGKANVTDPARQPGKQPHRHFRSPRCPVVRHPLSLTIMLPQLHYRGSRRGVLEALFGRRMRRRCTCSDLGGAGRARQWDGGGGLGAEGWDRNGLWMLGTGRGSLCLQS